MLVLSRHRDEEIMVGDNIVVTVVDIRGDKVRLGITAPKEVPVNRSEVFYAIQREQQRRSEPQDGALRSAGEVLQGGGDTKHSITQ